MNEEAVRQMHLENPIGEIIETYGGKGEIVGVVKDFHLESLNNPIGPVIITCQPDWTWTIYTRLQGDDLSKTIQQIEQVYKNFAPGFVFEYNFQDQEYERLYRSDHQIGTLVKWFAGLAIFISCLGLLGLAAFTVERKTKERGIRKVLGATAAHLLGMITKQYVILLLISLLLAIVPAYYLLDSWLNKFAYHINLEWWTLPLIGTGAIVLPLAVIVILTLHATRLNPVNSIRDNNSLGKARALTRRMMEIIRDGSILAFQRLISRINTSMAVFLKRPGRACVALAGERGQLAPWCASSRRLASCPVPTCGIKRFSPVRPDGPRM